MLDATDAVATCLNHVTRKAGKLSAAPDVWNMELDNRIGHHVTNSLISVGVVQHTKVSPRLAKPGDDIVP